jgi:Uma2 family endonuclease
MIKTLPERHRTTAVEYRRMGEASVFAPDARLELIAGEIIDMPPIGSRHAATVERFSRMFHHHAANDFSVRTQQPVALNDYSEPVPDIVLVRSRADDYAREHPTPADVLLVIEVAETTLRYDLDKKVPLYARSEIREVWIADLARREVVRFADSHDGLYRTRTVTPANASLSPILLPRLSVALSEILA